AVIRPAPAAIIRITTPASIYIYHNIIGAFAPTCCGIIILHLHNCIVGIRTIIISIGKCGIFFFHILKILSVVHVLPGNFSIPVFSNIAVVISILGIIVAIAGYTAIYSVIIMGRSALVRATRRCSQAKQSKYSVQGKSLKGVIS